MWTERTGKFERLSIDARVTVEDLSQCTMVEDGEECHVPRSRCAPLRTVRKNRQTACIGRKRTVFEETRRVRPRAELCQVFIHINGLRAGPESILPSIAKANGMRFPPLAKAERDKWAVLLVGRRRSSGITRTTCYFSVKCNPVEGSEGRDPARILITFKHWHIHEQAEINYAKKNRVININMH